MHFDNTEYLITKNIDQSNQFICGLINRSLVKMLRYGRSI